MNYTLITVIGAIISCVSVNAIMTELMDFRIKKRNALIAVLIFTLIDIVIMLSIYGNFGSTLGGQFYTTLGIIPALIFYFAISLYRDGSLFFSFFIDHIIAMVLIGLTNLVDSCFFTEGQVVSSVMRIVLFPLSFFLIHRFVSERYRKVRQRVRSGWTISAVLGAIIFFLMIYTYNYPALLYERPTDIPIFLGIIVIAFLFIFQTISSLYLMQERHELEKREMLFSQQMDSIKSRIKQTEIAERQLQIERHDIRHRYNTLLALLGKDNVKDALDYVNSSALRLDGIKHINYCENAIINATMESLAVLAEDEGIKLDVKLDVPEKLAVSSEEFSIVFANALENAINAVMKLPKEKRHIAIKCIDSPKLMLQIKNPVEGKILFDKDHIPFTDRKGHGVGVWSIEQYCAKNNAVSEYFVDNGYFVFRLAHLNT